MSEENTGKTVRFTLDPSNPPQLTPEQRQRLDSMRDEDIDLSDLPSQAGKPGWRPGLYPTRVADFRLAALKEKVLILDDNVAEFFKASGEDAPAKMNAVLREYAETHRKNA
jgi:uncharacterized protein (DUF4415 family)